MTEVETGASDAVDTTTGEDTGVDETETGSVTAEEVAATLKSSGMDVKVPKSEESDESDKADDTDAGDDTGSDDDDDEEIEDTKAKETRSKVEDKPVDAPETKEFSFEVTDKNGTTFKVNAGDDIDKTLADFESESTAQIMKIIKDLGDLERQKADYEADQAKQAEETEKNERITAIQEGWTKETQELQASGRIDKTTDAEGKNPRLTQVYDYMAEENEKRKESGRPIIESLEDALNGLEVKEAREAKEKAAKDAKETARKNGGLVGGSSAPVTGSGPVYKGGARNAQDAIRQMHLA